MFPMLGRIPLPKQTKQTTFSTWAKMGSYWIILQKLESINLFIFNKTYLHVLIPHIIGLNQRHQHKTIVWTKTTLPQESLRGLNLYSRVLGSPNHQWLEIPWFLEVNCHTKQSFATSKFAMGNQQTKHGGHLVPSFCGNVAFCWKFHVQNPIKIQNLYILIYIYINMDDTQTLICSWKSSLINDKISYNLHLQQNWEFNAPTSKTLEKIL